MEKSKVFTIETPQIGDVLALATMHIQSWKETYVSTESGLTESMVDDMLKHLLTNTDFRKNTITESLTNPEVVFYRIVKNSNRDIVGFIHGSKNSKFTELEGIYLLDEAKGSGIGGKLMKEFITWADKSKPCRLDIFSFNNKAIGFYTKYGFVKTDKSVQLYRDKLPYVEMIRPAGK